MYTNDDPLDPTGLYWTDKGFKSLQESFIMSDDPLDPTGLYWLLENWKIQKIHTAKKKDTAKISIVKFQLVPPIFLKKSQNTKMLNFSNNDPLDATGLY